MGFLGYLLLGVIAYATGWALRIYVLEKQPTAKAMSSTSPTNRAYSLTHPTILGYLAGFFVVMLLVSWLLGRLVLGHEGIDVAFILVNSVVATFVFSFGLSPDQARYDVPD